MTEAYLDVQPARTDWWDAELTIIGLYLVNGGYSRLVQLVDEEITREAFLEAMNGVSTVFTYDSKRFELPFIHATLGVDLARMYNHCDLMRDCFRRISLRDWDRAELGISRTPQERIDAENDMDLLSRYKKRGARDCQIACCDNDQNPMALLLRYNKENVVNLKALKEGLTEFRC